MVFNSLLGIKNLVQGAESFLLDPIGQHDQVLVAKALPSSTTLRHLEHALKSSECLKNSPVGTLRIVLLSTYIV